MLPDLRAGGAERLALYLAKDWLDKGFQLDIVLQRLEGELVFMADKRLGMKTVKAPRIRNTLYPFFAYFRDSKPAVTIVNMWPLTIMAILAWRLAGAPGRLYTIDHNHLSISTVRELRVHRWFLGGTIKVFYPLASGSIAVSSGVADDLSNLSGLSRGFFKVIYNPAARGIKVRPSDYREGYSLWGINASRRILNVGSLKRQKNHALLIKAFAKISAELNAALVIVGEGDLRTELEVLIAELHLSQSVQLVGFCADVTKWYLTADMFVLSSDWEGLPTVLIEALEAGLRIVSTDCPSGPAEILCNGTFGTLTRVGDLEALAEGIKASFREKPNPDLLKRRASDFSVESTSVKYLEYIGVLNNEI